MRGSCGEDWAAPVVRYIDSVSAAIRVAVSVTWACRISTTAAAVQGAARVSAGATLRSCAGAFDSSQVAFLRAYEEGERTQGNRTRVPRSNT